MYLKILGFGQTTISGISHNFKKSTLSIVIHAGFGISHQALWQAVLWTAHGKNNCKLQKMRWRYNRDKSPQKPLSMVHHYMLSVFNMLKLDPFNVYSVFPTKFLKRSNN